MTALSLIYAPNPIFKQHAEAVTVVDDDIRKIVDAMFEIMAHEKAVGLGGNMVGVLKRIVVVDLHKNDIPEPYTFINPEITWQSEDTQVFEEASLCFPGISAPITRPKSIKMRYLDYNGEQKQIEADGFFATVIQHEIDYLNGNSGLFIAAKTRYAYKEDAEVPKI